jgi:hypothetical protein
MNRPEDEPNNIGLISPLPPLVVPNGLVSPSLLAVWMICWLNPQVHRSNSTNSTNSSTNDVREVAIVHVLADSN